MASDTARAGRGASRLSRRCVPARGRERKLIDFGIAKLSTSTLTFKAIARQRTVHATEQCRHQDPMPGPIVSTAPCSRVVETAAFRATVYHGDRGHLKESPPPIENSVGPCRSNCRLVAPRWKKIAKSAFKTTKSSGRELQLFARNQLRPAAMMHALATPKCSMRCTTIAKRKGLARDRTLQTAPRRRDAPKDEDRIIARLRVVLLGAIVVGLTIRSGAADHSAGLRQRSRRFRRRCSTTTPLYRDTRNYTRNRSVAEQERPAMKRRHKSRCRRIRGPQRRGRQSVAL